MKGEALQATALTEQEAQSGAELAEIMAGLGAPQKSLSPKYFYDERGSELFEAICELPEYYLTRTEMAIMRGSFPEIARRAGPRVSVIEFGSGSSLKTRLLLEHLEEPAAYVPVDISRDHLLAAAAAVASDFPELEVLPVAADFTRPFPLPEPGEKPLRNLVYFPGSTIGNFSPRAAHELLRVMHQEAGENGALLIGVDLKKDPVILEHAYNDAAGVTEEFNLNMLRRLNREFGADFDLQAFRHRAVYDEPRGRIEMRLISLCNQRVRIGGRAFDFSRDEYLITEYSHKYGLEEFRQMVRRAGFEANAVWTDPQQWFSLHYCHRD